MTRTKLIMAALAAAACATLGLTTQAAAAPAGHARAELPSVLALPSTGHFHVCLKSAAGWCHHSHGSGASLTIQQCSVGSGGVCGPDYNVLTDSGFNYYLFQIDGSNECMRAQGSNNNVIMAVGNCDSTDHNEEWTGVNSGGDNYTFQNRATGDFMYVDSPQSEFQVNHGSCAAGDGHWCHWILT